MFILQSIFTLYNSGLAVSPILDVFYDTSLVLKISPSFAVFVCGMPILSLQKKLLLIMHNHYVPRFCYCFILSALGYARRG